MFLAWNEILHTKLRYGLVVGVIFLVGFMVFFLTGLSYGLAQQNRTAVDTWNIDGLLLAKDSDNSLNLSTFSEKELANVRASEKTYLAQLSAIASKENSQAKEKASVSLFAIDKESFLKPKVTEGRLFEEAGEVVADVSLKQDGFKLGDKISLSGTDQTVKIVGFTKNAQFNVAPVLYLSLPNFEKIKYDQTFPEGEAKINAIVYRGKVTSFDKDKLAKVSVATFINDLPGYSAQVLTFSFMIGSLIIIAAIVIGIFIYVLTMQKRAIFGIMKAQGISNGYIAKSIMVQTFLLATFGTVLALIISVSSSYILPAAVPYENNWTFLLGSAILMIVTAVVGSAFSVKTIVSIDPIQAIG